MAEAWPNFADAVRKTCEAYAEGLAAVTKALEGVSRQEGDTQRQAIDQWMTLARTSKDNLIAALNQGFEIWERECRRLAGAPMAGAMPTWTNPLEVWAETWKRSMDSLFGAASQPGAFWTEQARRQAELTQQAIQESLRAWQRLWRAP